MVTELENHSIQAILDIFSNLPDDSNKEFTNEITDFIAQAPIEVNEDLLYILQNHEDRQLRFAAFYSLVVYYRRYKLNSRLEPLVNEYGGQFTSKPLYKFTMSTIYKNKGSRNELNLALQYAQEAIEQVVNYPGYFNNYAEIVAHALEEGIKLDDKEKTISKAFLYINKAIIINNKYAKYYCNLGRLQYCTGEFTEAKASILKAIDLEDNSKRDYAIRIADYQYYLLKCQSTESLTKLTETVNEKTLEIHTIKNELEKSMEKEKNKSLESLVFFTAIITFIVSTIQIASKSKFNEAVSLILVMVGGLLISFGSFSMILKTDKKSIIITIFFVTLGIGIIVMSLLLNNKTIFS